MANSKPTAPQGAVNQVDKQPEGETVYHTVDLDSLPRGIDGENPVSADNPAPENVHDPVERQKFIDGDKKVDTETKTVEDKTEKKDY